MVKPRLTYFFAFLCLLVLNIPVYRAQSELDSMRLALKSAKSDTNKLMLLNALVEIAPEGEWETYNEQLGSLAEQLLSDKEPAISRSALRFKANFINNNGYIAYQYGDIPKALECYHESLKIHEQLKSKTAIALAYNNIGFVYSGQGDMDMALSYYKKSLERYTQLKDKSGIALSMNNIGHMLDLEAIQLTDKNAPYDSIVLKLHQALSYYKESLRLHEEINDKFGVANCLNNIGAIYSPLMEQWKRKGIKQDSLAWYAKLELECHIRSVQMKQEIGDQAGEAQSYSNLGWHYYRAKDYAKAAEYAKRSLKMGRELGFPGTVRDASKLLFLVYKDGAKYKDALAMHELFINMRDSIQNAKNKKLGIQKQIQYEYDKKAAADSVRVAEEKKVIAAQLNEERTQRFALYGGLALVLVFAGFIFTRFRISQKQKRIIEKQKHEVEYQKELVDEKQKEIVDSITYAKRLQQAILPPQAYMDKYLPENFVLYKPKDIVAGDFYWMFESEDYVLAAAADSTGHGVPGAMVSIVCSNALEKAVKEFGLREPGAILDKVTDLVLDTFAKSGEEIKDGMDISLLSLNKKHKELKWSGAHNALWYISPGSTEVSEIKANKQPVGKADHRVPFTTHTIDWTEGTLFYLLTDGYADQFGGPKAKKYKYKQLEAKLLSLSHLSMHHQKEALSEDFEVWRGKLEQVDDVTVIGIRL